MVRLLIFIFLLCVEQIMSPMSGSEIIPLVNNFNQFVEYMQPRLAPEQRGMFTMFEATMNEQFKSLDPTQPLPDALKDPNFFKNTWTRFLKEGDAIALDQAQSFGIDIVPDEARSWWEFNAQHQEELSPQQVKEKWDLWKAQKKIEPTPAQIEAVRAEKGVPTLTTKLKQMGVPDKEVNYATLSDKLDDYFVAMSDDERSALAAIAKERGYPDAKAYYRELRIQSLGQKEGAQLEVGQTWEAWLKEKELLARARAAQLRQGSYGALEFEPELILEAERPVALKESGSSVPTIKESTLEQAGVGVVEKPQPAIEVRSGKITPPPEYSRIQTTPSKGQQPIQITKGVAREAQVSTVSGQSNLPESAVGTLQRAPAKPSPIGSIEKVTTVIPEQPSTPGRIISPTESLQRVGMPEVQAAPEIGMIPGIESSGKVRQAVLPSAPESLGAPKLLPEVRVAPRVAEVMPPRSSTTAIRPAPSAGQPPIQVGVHEAPKVQASVLSDKLPEVESIVGRLERVPVKPAPTMEPIVRGPKAQIAEITRPVASTRPAPSLPPAVERIPTSAAVPSSPAIEPVRLPVSPQAKPIPLPEIPSSVVPKQAVPTAIARPPFQEPLPEFRSPLQEPFPSVPRAKLPPVEVPRALPSAPRAPSVIGGAAASGGKLAAQGTAQATTQTTKALIAAIDMAAIIDLGINILIFIAMETMPYWLPLIYKQSGMVNNTLYEARAYISFQGGETVSCSRANFHFYPYNRKDFGRRSWAEVGGDRGRICLPERYVATVFVPQRQLVSIQGAYGNKTKDMKIFSLAFKNNNQFSITWKNA